MRKSLVIIVLALLGGLAGSAQAAGSDQFYFVAQPAALGSLSAPGQSPGERAVYLRWDVVEGRLPGDLQAIRLERGSTVLLEAEADAVMSEADIAQLYRGPAQQRRLLETLSWLREQAAAEDPPRQLTAADFPGEVRQRLLNSPYWAHLASRVDFNIARARYRGYLDTEAGSGSHVYTLYGIAADGSEVRLGRAEADLSDTRNVAAAEGFEQIRLGRCDAPEEGKDHGAVALTWDHGGASKADRYASSLLIAGYDLYRSTSALAAGMTSVPAEDIAALAAANPHRQDGSPDLPGLERVNQQPIMISGRPGDGRPYAQHMQTAEELAAAGLEPGERRAYYLVPRDFTGNYGPAVSAVVEVPDLRRPAAPWAVEVETHDGEDRLSLVWDRVDLRSYHRSHQDGRQYCNLDTARAEGVLRYVPAGQQCGRDPAVEVKLDVRDYRVYRFGSYQTAVNFKDRDGDGVDDATERAATPPGEKIPYSCTAEKVAGTNQYLLDKDRGYSTRERALPSGRRQVVLDDDFPARQHGRVVWYRVASVGAGGQVSRLSPPVRGHFPDRSLPTRPVLGQDISLSVPDGCGYLARQGENKGEGPMAVDLTGDARQVRASCSTGYSGSWPLRSGEWGSSASPDSSACSQIQSTCANADVVQVDFLGAAGQVLDGKQVPIQSFDSCPGFASRVELSDSCTGSRQVEPGETLAQPPVLSVNHDQCVAIYREIDGKDYKVDTVCGGQGTVVDYGAGELSQGDQVCLSAAVQNDNARSSPRTRLPCFSLVTANDAPAPPQPVELSFTGATAEVAWQLPEERTSASVLQWYRPGQGDRRVKTVPHAGARGGPPRRQDLALSPAPGGGGWQEQWCVRARVVGQAAGADQSGVLSPWSEPLCALRLPAGEQAGKYLPWPEVPVPPEGAPLQSAYLGADQVPVLLVSEPIDFTGQCDISPPYCDPNGGSACLPQEQYFECPGDTIPDPVCGKLRQQAGGQLGFVAYRQSMPLSGGPATDYVQVSPLIDDFHCAARRIGEKVGSGLVGTRLDDPYVKLVRFAGNPIGWDGGRLIFVDRYPHVAGRKYRYQFVYFDSDGEIIETRTSQQWLEVQQ